MSLTLSAENIGPVSCVVGSAIFRARQGNFRKAGVHQIAAMAGAVDPALNRLRDRALTRRDVLTNGAPVIVCAGGTSADAGAITAGVAKKVVRCHVI